MAQATSLLQTLGLALGGMLSSIGRTGQGYQCLAAAAAAQQGRLGLRGLSAAASTSTQASEAAAPSHAGADSPGAGKSDTEQASTSGATEGGADAGAFSTGYRRVLSDRRMGQLGALEGIVHIQNTFNNIILTLTDKQGSIKTYTSAGVVGFKGSRKSQPVAAEKAAEELARRALRLGYSSVQVRLKGPGATKQYAVQSLAAAGLTLTSLADVTPIPYNGCRAPKKRRV